MKTVIRNGRLVLKDWLLTGYDMVIENGRICGMYPEKSWKQQAEEVYEVDADGRLIMPGMIDIHSDMIEACIQPRNTAIMEFEMGMREAEKILAGSGITTIFHSISMFREGAWDVKEIRQAPQVKKLAVLAARYRHEKRLIRHRYHLRYEIDNLACYTQVAEMIEEGLVDLLSFMDHTPGQGQYRNLEIYRRHQPDGGKNLTEEEFQKLLKKEMEKETVTFERLKALADLAKRQGISVASHDDDTIEKLGMNRALGVKISEFPITLAVAQEAVKQGFMTVLGAPNILLGGSHSGNLSAMEAIRAGAASVLVSDYYPQALLQAVFRLFGKEGIPVWEAVNYVTLNPACAVGLDGEIGSLEEGKKADFLIVNEEDGVPFLEQVFVNGECIARYQYREADEKKEKQEEIHA